MKAFLSNPIARAEFLIAFSAKNMGAETYAIEERIRESNWEAEMILDETEPFKAPVMNSGYYGVMDGAYHVDVSELTPDERISLANALQLFTCMDLE